MVQEQRKEQKVEHVTHGVWSGETAERRRLAALRPACCRVYKTFPSRSAPWLCKHPPVMSRHHDKQGNLTRAGVAGVAF